MLGLLFLLGFAAARPNTAVSHESFYPEHVLRVTAQNYSLACQDRYSVVINGSVPGPELRIPEGKVSWIRVYNDMSDSNLTMHWHGLTAFTAPFSDGTPLASQWPIPPDHFFDYEIRPEVGYAGSYFYHSHVGFQAVSASGPLIVEDSQPLPYTYNEERLVYLSDFFNKTDKVIEDGLVADPFTWSGETNAVLVNGNGRLTSDDPGECALASIKVEPGKTYRLRYISSTALSFLSLAIDSHDVSVIEADGQYTKPLNTSYLQISSGQRYSVLLKAKSESELKQLNKRQFYMQFSTLDRPSVLTGFALLEYPNNTADSKVVPSEPPLPVANTTDGFLDYQLQPLVPHEDFPTLEEVTRRVTIQMHQNVSQHTIWLQNGYPWTEHVPRSPYLIDIYEGKLDPDASYQRAIANGDSFDNITRTFPAKIGEILEIVWQNEGAVSNGGVDSHPLHAHGRHYFDIGGGDGLYNATENEERLKTAHPILRDTTVLYRYRTQTTPRAPSGWRAWRIRVTDAGVWAIHCHILQHMIMGMQTVWTFGDRHDILTQGGPVTGGYLTYGGSAYGNATHSPIVQHYFD
ncbi:laccase, putative [Paecilomyces variotii No. 5]|uniref:Laccase, putative n=1 Tax=Byssochlamys spectabilis (strain No. 5 / NBRC 109023) TaxID=1356009 RepID=V5I3G1_BYSSN|nr:laccase, putative [Paecilomyces variotii No. 5]